MSQVTELLTSTAEISNLMSVVTVLLGLVAMMVFLVRLIYQDIADGGGSGVTKINVKTPQTVMTRVELPFTVSLNQSHSVLTKNVECYDDADQVMLRVSAKHNYYFRYYWSVPIKSFHHMLRAPWPWLYKAAVASDTDMLSSSHCSAPTMVHGHEDRTVKVPRPRDLQLGPAPREVYPLVVILLRCGSDVAEDHTQVTCLVNIIHLKDATCPIPSQILATYIRQGSGLTQLRPLYVSDDHESSDTESAEDSETEDWPSSASITRATCVVCQTARVNRVALPCRHANTCGQCFDRLQSRCPMCRSFISSYFLLFPDPEPPPDIVSAPVTSEPPTPRSWSSMWRHWNIRINNMMGLREN